MIQVNFLSKSLFIVWIHNSRDLNFSHIFPIPIKIILVWISNLIFCGWLLVVKRQGVGVHLFCIMIGWQISTYKLKISSYRGLKWMDGHLSELDESIPEKCSKAHTKCEDSMSQDNKIIIFSSFILSEWAGCLALHPDCLLDKSMDKRAKFLFKNKVLFHDHP